MVWLGCEGKFPTARFNSIIKAVRMEKNCICSIDITNDHQSIISGLKSIIQQDCFELNRLYYKESMKKYKQAVGESSRFIQPWMSTVYYFFKLAIIEECRGDFTSALKYYHSILAKFKQIIEGTSEVVESRFQMIGYLRYFADICFIRVNPQKENNTKRQKKL